MDDRAFVAGLGAAAFAPHGVPQGGGAPQNAVIDLSDYKRFTSAGGVL